VANDGERRRTGNEFNEVTFLHDVVGYGTKEPLEVVLDNSETAAVVLPYTKSGESLPGQWTLVAYVDSADIGIEERKPFREHIKIDSAWAGATAAGCIENENWTNNPKFKLTIPEDMVDVTVLLEQERAPQDTTQFQVMPYKSHIGFYLYNDGTYRMNGWPRERMCASSRRKRLASMVVQSWRSSWARCRSSRTRARCRRSSSSTAGRARRTLSCPARTDPTRSTSSRSTSLPTHPCN